MRLRLTLSVVFVILVSAWPAQARTDACQAAEREMVYGTIALEDAKDKKGFLESAGQFQAAAAKAPNCARAHFNLGLVYEKAGEFQKAIGPLRTYLKLAPNAGDAAQVRKKIYALEYRAKKAARKAAEPSLAGTWCYVFNGQRNCKSAWQARKSKNKWVFELAGAKLFLSTQGSALAGWSYPHHKYCPDFYFRIDGTLSRNRARIILNSRPFAGGSGWPPPCDQLRTTPGIHRLTLVRR